MAALDAAYSIAVLLVAVGGVGGVMWLTKREPTDEESDVAGTLTFLAISIFVVAVVWVTAFGG